MSINPQGGAPISLTVFGGLCTESAAPDLPEGVSPDCQDVEFLPGSVFSRRGLKKVFATPFGTVTTTYAKSFVTPTGQIWNFYLDSAGNLWREDATNTPGSAIVFATFVQPGSYAKSITAFGREYFAFSDLLHGSDVPLQWDGGNLDRVSQNGPGSPPTVANLALPAVAMVATGAAPTFANPSIFPDQKVNGYWTAINIYATGVSTIPVGSIVFISGTASPFDNTTTGYLVIQNPGPGGAVTCQAYFPGSQGSVGPAGLLTQGTGGVTLNRQGNYVTVKTAAAHNLQVGYMAQISGPAGPPATAIPPLAVGGGITQVVVNNEDQPGVATITTASAHGLIPGNQVIIQGIAGVAIGGGILQATWRGGIVEVATNSAHGLTAGALVRLSGTSTGKYDGSFTVLSIVDSTKFTFAMTPLADPGANGAVGAVTLMWPAASATSLDYFTVVAAPSPTVFQIQFNYADATFTTGTVSFPWDGTFVVTSVPNSTTAVYYHVGPNGTSATVGQVTPYGQCAPGQHQCQVLFLTRQGYITRPSPPATFVANGGQYISVTNIPTGPASVVARILAFTGAGGSYFFYIPTVPQVNNQIIGTATQINDNTTTSVVLDFGDNTLFSGIGINTPGNTPANNIVIDGALGFGYYAGRLLVWGMRNTIQNLLNMGFDGGSQPLDGTSGAPIARPTGWTPTALGGALTAGHLTNQAWKITLATGAGTIQQGFYQDAYGAPIATPLTQYSFRAWIQQNTGAPVITATISSASTGFSSTVTLTPSTAVGSFMQGDFSLKMPAAIPSDMILSIAATGTGVVTIDEMSIIYTANPFLDSVMYASYFQNPEAIDGVSGKLGSIQDTHKIMDLAAIRQTLYFLTQDPGGRVHQTSDNGTTEPAGWTVAEVAENCGLVSAFALAKSQADSSSSAGGEEWFAWLSSTGPRIFGGDLPWKIGQEIAPDFDKLGTATGSYGGVSNPARLTAWALNSPNERLIYFGLPIDIPNGPTVFTPNKIYVLNYRELETAYQIGNSPPIHTSFTGRLIATDHARKWTRWNLTLNGAALMYRYVAPAGTPNTTPTLAVVLFSGDSLNPGTTGFGNAYVLSPTKFQDDDYSINGPIVPYYVTFFVPSHEQEAGLLYQLPNGQRVPLGAGRKLFQYLSAFVGVPAGLGGTSLINISFLVDSLSNPWPISVSRPLVVGPKFDLECGAGSAQGQRIAIRFASVPQNPGTGPGQSNDTAFFLQHATVWLRGARLSIRGAAL